MLSGLAHVWMNALDQWDKMRHYQRQMVYYDLQSPVKNIVGECYGWQDCYSSGNGKHCPECEYFSWSFTYIINGPELTLDRELLEFKREEFSTHWESRHLIRKSKVRARPVSSSQANHILLPQALGAPQSAGMLKSQVG